MIPALSDSRGLRFGAFAGLYVAQGIPWGIFMVALPTWLAEQGRTSAEIGSFLAAVSLPWTLKLLTGPIMDRFSFLPMGRRRPWVIGAQLGILGGTIALSGVPMTDAGFVWMLGIGFFINFCAAWQDVAVDGMAIDVLPEDERARANAFMFGGQALGIAASSAGGAWLLAAFGLAATAMVMSLAVVLIALIPIIFRERTGERLLPWTPGDALPRSLALSGGSFRSIVRDLLRVLVLPMSVLLVAIKFGDRVVVGLLNAAFPVMTTQEVGFDATFYPTWTSVAGTVAAVVGVAAAPLIDRFGAKRALFWGLAFKAVVIGSAGFAAPWWSNEMVLVTVIFMIGIAGQLLTVASIAMFMNLCSVKIAATQFAVYMALSNLALSTGSALLGPVDAWLDFDQLFFVAAALDLAVLALIPLFSLEKHRIRADAALEPATAERA